jgi:hypothetical protein
MNETKEQKEQEELKSTNNSLYDLVTWSKIGYIIILSSGSKTKCFCRPEYKQSNKLVQINLTSMWRDLIEDEEWPWYLIDNGCIRLEQNELKEMQLNIAKHFTL